MNETSIMAIGLAVLSVASGMLGLGVAFAAVPFLGLFLHDLVHEVQPLSLFLNGVTALFSLFGFAESRLVTWRPAILLAVVTTITAPLGSYLAQIVSPKYLWAVYFVAVAYLAYRMFLPEKPNPEQAAKPGATANAAAAGAIDPNLTIALVLAVPISVLAGMLGVGPGFLLLPTLILLGYEFEARGGDERSRRDAAFLLGVASAYCDGEGRPSTRFGARDRGRDRLLRRRADHQPLCSRPTAEAAVRTADRRHDRLQDSIRSLREKRAAMANKVVIHIFHADDSSLGSGAHVSERIRQVKEERGVALEVFVFGPAEEALADPAREEFRLTLTKLCGGRDAGSCLPQHRRRHGQGRRIHAHGLHPRIRARRVRPVCARGGDSRQLLTPPLSGR